MEQRRGTWHTCGWACFVIAVGRSLAAAGRKGELRVRKYENVWRRYGSAWKRCKGYVQVGFFPCCFFPGGGWAQDTILGASAPSSLPAPVPYLPSPHPPSPLPSPLPSLPSLSPSLSPSSLSPPLPSLPLPILPPILPPLPLPKLHCCPPPPFPRCAGRLRIARLHLLLSDHTSVTFQAGTFPPASATLGDVGERLGLPPPFLGSLRPSLGQLERLGEGSALTASTATPSADGPTGAGKAAVKGAESVGRRRRAVSSGWVVVVPHVGPAPSVQVTAPAPALVGEQAAVSVTVVNQGVRPVKGAMVELLVKLGAGLTAQDVSLTVDTQVT